ncbi:MAG: peptidoglycan-binding protein [Methylococcaceae bacterium]|nr:peptidoglycan-binding protein [Methylococcaceae bacterium]MCI0733576.1 peptidoglycan-binding protein [Methylococcaceae bacterium]
MLINLKRPLITGTVAAITFAISGLTGSTIRAETPEEREKALMERVQQLELENAKLKGNQDTAFSELEDALPSAKAGQCFSKVLVPAVYEDRSEKVVVREAAHEIKITPPVYESVVEKITVEEASEEIVEIPAVYKTVKENVLIDAARKVWRTGLGEKAKPAPADLVAAALANGVPKDAPVNSCYEEFQIPAKIETIEEKLTRKQAGTRIEIIPAQYEWVEKKIMVKDASEKIIDVPPEYETKEEKVLERAAFTTWKRGRGPIERIDHSTGEIMCLVEVPAEYKTVQKKVLKTPATTKKVAIPAEFKTIKIRRLVSPAQQKVIEIPETYQTVRKSILKSPEIVAWRPENTVEDGSPTGKKICLLEIAAKYHTIAKEVIEKPATTKKVPVPEKIAEIKINKLVSPAKETKVEIPAEYQSLSKRVKVSDEKLAWRSVLCETNTTKDLLANIQTALQKAGFYTGPVNGSMGRQTQSALREFQKKNNLETGGITLRTLDVLGVKVGNQP